MSDDWSFVMSCCRSAKEHDLHVAFRNALKRVQAAGWTCIPPVSTGFGSRAMSTDEAVTYLRERALS